MARLDQTGEPQDAATWPVDVSGDLRCWKGLRSARQTSCAWVDDHLVCQVELRSGPSSDPVQGLFCIQRGAFDSIPLDHRTEALKRKLERYVCRLRPQTWFVFELRRLGPFLINWP
jgi:hypothetical protein